MSNNFVIDMDAGKLKSVSTLGLAHIGDAVYELLVRTLLVTQGEATSASLHRATIRYVSAPAQSKAADRLRPLLSEDELAVFRRGRNAHVNTIPHNAARADYMKATALEALFGWLYLRGQTERIGVLFEAATEERNAD